jgi:N-acetylmuramoyl-L-alanine amidase CwlA
MQVRKMLLPTSKYKLKAPYDMKAEWYVVHNTANDASANNEIKYMISNDSQTSFHYAIDNKEIVQGIEENRNAWHSGDSGTGKGNRKGIGIEICYSKSGGTRFDLAEKMAAKFIAEGLKSKGWGIDKVKKHQDFSGKYCPHRTLDKGWDRFLNMIKAEMGQDKLTISINGNVKHINGHIKSGISYAVIDKIEIPLRTLGEGLGFKVGWDAQNKVVVWND